MLIQTNKPVVPVKHYPCVWENHIRAAMASRSPEVRARLLRMVRNPLFRYRPLPQALRFHQSDKRFRWCLGGNRSSKSESVCVEVLWYATGMHPFKKIKTPNVGWYSTNTWEMVGSILWDKLKGYLHDDKGDVIIPHRVAWRNKGKDIPSAVFIDTSNGESVIIFKAYEQGREIYQGTERRYIANDEQFNEGIYLEQITRIGGGDQLDFFAAMTPIEPQPWLEKRLTVKKPPSWDIFEYPIDDNRISRGGFIRDEDIDAAIEEWPEEVQPTRRLGKWGSFMGAVYKTFSRAVHVVPEQEESKFILGNKIPITGNWRLPVGGIDFGGANPFVHLWAVRIPHMDDAWYVFDEYYWEYRKRGVRLMRDHAKDIRERTKKWGIPEGRLQRVWADHDVQDRNELAAEGVPSSPAVKEVLPGIETVQTLLKVRTFGSTRRPQLFIAERCSNTVEQLITYKWPEGTDTKNPQDVPVPLDDHCCDALRYLLHSERGMVPTGAGPSKEARRRNQRTFR